MGKHSRLGILLLLVAVIGWFGVVRGQIKTFSELSLTAKARSVELESHTQRLADLRFIKDQGETVQKTLRSMFLAMPRQSQVPEVLVMIESIGANSGIIFNSATLGTPSGSSAAAAVASEITTASVAEVPVNISFTGSLDNTLRFIDAVQKNIRTAIIRSQTITADPSGNMSVTMQLGLVYQGGN